MESSNWFRSNRFAGYLSSRAQQQVLFHSKPLVVTPPGSATVQSTTSTSSVMVVSSSSSVVTNWITPSSVNGIADSDDRRVVGSPGASVNLSHDSQLACQASSSMDSNGVLATDLMGDDYCEILEEVSETGAGSSCSDHSFVHHSFNVPTSFAVGPSNGDDNVSGVGPMVPLVEAGTMQNRRKKLASGPQAFQFFKEHLLKETSDARSVDQMLTETHALRTQCPFCDGWHWCLYKHIFTAHVLVNNFQFMCPFYGCKQATYGWTKFWYHFQHIHPAAKLASILFGRMYSPQVDLDAIVNSVAHSVDVVHSVDPVGSQSQVAIDDDGDDNVLVMIEDDECIENDEQQQEVSQHCTTFSCSYLETEKLDRIMEVVNRFPSLLAAYQGKIARQIFFKGLYARFGNKSVPLVYITIESGIVTLLVEKETPGFDKFYLKLDIPSSSIVELNYGFSLQFGLLVITTIPQFAQEIGSLFDLDAKEPTESNSNSCFFSPKAKNPKYHKMIVCLDMGSFQSDHTKLIERQFEGNYPAGHNYGGASLMQDMLNRLSLPNGMQLVRDRQTYIRWDEMFKRIREERARVAVTPAQRQASIREEGGEIDFSELALSGSEVPVPSVAQLVSRLNSQRAVPTAARRRVPVAPLMKKSAQLCNLQLMKRCNQIRLASLAAPRQSTDVNAVRDPTPPNGVLSTYFATPPGVRNTIESEMPVLPDITPAPILTSSPAIRSTRRYVSISLESTSSDGTTDSAMPTLEPERDDVTDVYSKSEMQKLMLDKLASDDVIQILRQDMLFKNCIIFTDAGLSAPLSTKHYTAHTEAGWLRCRHCNFRCITTDLMYAHKTISHSTKKEITTFSKCALCGDALIEPTSSKFDSTVKNIPTYLCNYFNHMLECYHSQKLKKVESAESFRSSIVDKFFDDYEKKVRKNGHFYRKSYFDSFLESLCNYQCSMCSYRGNFYVHQKLNCHLVGSDNSDHGSWVCNICPRRHEFVANKLKHFVVHKFTSAVSRDFRKMDEILAAEAQAWSERERVVELKQYLTIASDLLLEFEKTNFLLLPRNNSAFLCVLSGRLVTPADKFDHCGLKKLNLHGQKPKCSICSLRVHRSQLYRHRLLHDLAWSSDSQSICAIDSAEMFEVTDLKLVRIDDATVFTEVDPVLPHQTDTRLWNLREVQINLVDVLADPLLLSDVRVDEDVLSAYQADRDHLQSHSGSPPSTRRHSQRISSDANCVVISDSGMEPEANESSEVSMLNDDDVIIDGSIWDKMKEVSRTPQGSTDDGSVTLMDNLVILPRSTRSRRSISNGASTFDMDITPVPVEASDEILSKIAKKDNDNIEEEGFNLRPLTICLSDVLNSPVVEAVSDDGRFFKII